MIRKYYLNPDIYRAKLGILSELAPLLLSSHSCLGNIAIVWQDLNPNYLLSMSFIL